MEVLQMNFYLNHLKKMNNKTMEERFDEKFNFADTFEDSRRLCDSIQNDVKYFIEQEIELAKKEERDRIVEMIEEVTGEMRTSETDKIITLITNNK